MRKILLPVLLCTLWFSCQPEETPTRSEVETPPPGTPDITASSLEVTEVLPAMNDIGDIVNIKGKNFSRNLTLSLNDEKIVPTLLNDSLIKFKIPFGDYDPFNFQLKLKNEGEPAVILQNPYALFEPVIDSIPARWVVRENLVLYGKHLTNPTWSKMNILYLDDLNIELISHTKDSLVFQLPWSIDKFEYDVLVKAQLQEASLPGGLRFPYPEIHSVSKKSVEIGEEILVYGKNFYPIHTDRNKMFIQGNPAEVLEAYSDSLRVRIPLGPYETRDITELKFQLFEKEITFEVDMDITSTWYMYGYKRDPEISGGMASVGTITRWSFKANNAFYFNVFKKIGYDPVNNILYKYTPEQDEWEEVILPIPTDDLEFGKVLEFYPLEGTNTVYIYIQRDTNNFYKFNVVTRELVRLKDLESSSVLRYGTGFHANGNFYYGLGYFEDPTREVNKKFWKYNKSANTWTEIGEMPDVHETYPRFGTTIFKGNNSVIIGNGHEQAYDLWEFSTDETWTRKSDIINPLYDTPYIQKEDIGFFYNYITNSFYEYDIPGDLWTKREDLRFKNYGLGGETMFIHEGHIYYVGYLLNYSPEPGPYFRHDHIILRTELSNF